MLRHALKALVFIALSSWPGWTQSTAQISGTVTDRTGAVLPGVEITATQTETDITRTAVTNETGAYQLLNLAIGPYRIEAALPGFRTFVQTGILLQVASNPVINAVLEVGQITDRVEVQANAAMVETRTVGVGQVMETERILELPLNGRNVADLVVLSGGAVQTGVANNRAMTGGVAISVAGGLSFGVSYILDGAMHNDVRNNLNLPFPFPDALTEFKVETGGLSAQSGMHSGAQVNAVTKSGTNEFHGSLFEFVRNDLFNAREYFSRTNSTLKRNQFGGTAGGPIVRNKLFFFAGYQGTTTRQDPASTISFVPTAAMLAGDFTAATSSACRSGGQPLVLRNPFGNNQINPAQYSRAALNIASKLPKADDQCGSITWGAASKSNEGQAVGRLDYQLTDKHSIFGRYIATFVKSPVPYGEGGSDNVLSTTTSGLDNLAQSVTAGLTSLLGGNSVLSIRLVGNRVGVTRIAPEFFSPEDVGIQMFSYIPKFTDINVTGAFRTGGTAGTNKTPTAALQVASDLNTAKGSHQLSIGLNVAHWRGNLNGPGESMGRLSVNAQGTGHALADFLIGRLASLAQSAPNQLYTSQSYAGAYVADTWRANPRFTLNYGVRWEPFFPQQVRNGRIYHFDEAAFRAGVKSTQFRNAPAGFFYPGDAGFPSKAGMNHRWWDFAPRVGFAWDVQGDGRTSIRSSWSLGFDFVPGEFHQFTVLSNPWAGRTSITTPIGGLDDPWRSQPGGNPFPVVFNADSPFGAYGTFNTMNYDTKRTTVNTWNLSIQRQVAANWLASASYIGSQTAHLWTQKQLNPAVYLPDVSCVLNNQTFTPCSSTSSTNQRRILGLTNFSQGSLIGDLIMVDDGGTASYNGLLLSVQRRAANGTTITANYTWSHCISDQGGTTLQPGGGVYVDSNNRDADRGNCDSDRRHSANITAVASTPRFEQVALRAIATGWRLSGIYRVSTGSYLTIVSGQDYALTGIGSQRPDQILEDVYGNKSLTNYLNPAAFARPADGRNGTTGRASIQGPGTWGLDLALSRIFPFRESQRLEFRAEAFNVTNSLRMGNPNTNTSNNNFGQITTAGDPRIMQFAVKYIF